MVKKLRKLVKKFVRVGTYNAGNATNAKLLSDLEEWVRQGVQILGLQEVADRLSVLKAFRALHPDWDFFNGDGRPGSAKTAILYQKSVGEVTAQKSVTLVGPRRLPQGAGPENAGAKVANRIRFRIGRKRVNFIVAHQYATVNNRRQAARLFMDALSHVIRRRLGTVIFVGDLNMTPGHALMHALRVLMTGASHVGGTHGPREIDRILVRGGEIIECWSKRGSSDHRAVFADVQF